MKKLMVALFAGALACSVAQAGIQQGDFELSVFASANATSSSDDDSDTTSVVLLGGTGNFFIFDLWSVGFTGLGASSSTGDDDENDTTMTMLALRSDFYFNFGENQKVVPYVGLQLGQITVSSGDDDESSVASYGVQGGVKIFVSENTSMNVELSSVSYEPEDSDETLYVNSLTAGISYYFGH